MGIDIRQTRTQSWHLLVTPSQPQIMNDAAYRLDAQFLKTDVLPVIAEISLTIRAWRRLYWALNFDETRLKDYASLLALQALNDNLTDLLANSSSDQAHRSSIHSFASGTDQTIELAVSLCLSVAEPCPHCTIVISTRTECDVYQVGVID